MIPKCGAEAENHVGSSSSLLTEGLLPESSTSSELDIASRELSPSPYTTDSTALSRQESRLFIQPTWTGFQVDPEDSRYFHFFICYAADSTLLTELFPRSIHDVFARTAMSKTLQQAVLAVSAIAADSALQRPLVRALTHKQRAINLLQQSLSTGDITEEIAISIFLMLYMDTFSKTAISQGHLKGLYLVLKHVHPDLEDPFVWKNISPVLMLIWRMAISIDSLTASLNRAMPVLPASPRDSSMLHMQWLSSLSKEVRNINLALASFALEDIFHRANHWLRECEVVTMSKEFIENPQMQATYNAIIEQRVTILREEHAKWIELPACALAVKMEQDAQSSMGEAFSQFPQFLDYPPLVLYDRTFCVLLNGWRLAYLAISVFPTSLKPARTLTQINHAIDICRTHAALELSPSSKDYLPEFFAVLLAGITFMGGRQYKREFQWVYDQIARIDSMQNDTLVQMQEFIDRVKGFNVFDIPEWSLDSSSLES